jgi:hypothetical protein
MDRCTSTILLDSVVDGACGSIATSGRIAGGLTARKTAIQPTATPATIATAPIDLFGKFLHRVEARSLDTSSFLSGPGQQGAQEQPVNKIRPPQTSRKPTPRRIRILVTSADYTHLTAPVKYPQPPNHEEHRENAHKPSNVTPT